MFFPYSTDAPIYYWPIMTVGLIVVNVVVFVATVTAVPEQIEPWILQWGNGLHPLQWISSCFLHAGFLHLLGNMLCLWGFGLVVEGKIGWWRFLLVYLLIAAVANLNEQLLMLGASEGGSLGASGAIFGVMVMALIWAPKNEMSCILIVYFRPFEFDCSILGVASFFLVLQVVFWLITVSMHGGDMAFAMTSEALHLLGAAVGFGLGITMLKKGWVDCENWDLLSVLAGRHTMSESQRRELLQESAEWQEEQRKRSASALEQIRAITAEGRPELAYKAHQKMARTVQGWTLPDADFLKLILSFHEQKKWSASVEPMVEYLRAKREHERQVRLRLAHVLIEFEKRPGQALQVLSKLVPSELSDSQRNLLERLKQKALALVADDPYELVDGDW